MIHNVKIGGREIGLAWNQNVASRFQFRASKIGGSPSISDFTNPKKAAAAYGSFLWVIMPQPLVREYPSPEDLYVAIEESEVPAIHAAIFNIFNDMLPDIEKKSTSKNSRLPKSNSGSRKKNSTSSTRR